MKFADRQAAAWHQIREQFEGHVETVNGPGSTYLATQEIRAAMPYIIDKYDIRSILDAPCGEWNWMQHVNLTGITYIGWDVDPVSIKRNRAKWPQHTWEHINLLNTTWSLPNVDLILCRDFFLHLPNRYINVVLRKFRNSGSDYLLTTNWPGADNKRVCDLEGGEDDRPGYYCQPVDLDAEPFSLGPRLESFVEDTKSGQEMVLYRL